MSTSTSSQPGATSVPTDSTTPGRTPTPPSNEDNGNASGTTQHDTQDYYEILSVDKTATADDIKKAYRKLAIKYHPDKNLDNTAEAATKFAQVNRANQILSDVNKRKIYDKNGHAGIQTFEQFGENDTVLQVLLMGKCAKILVGVLFCFTGCCCCLCCCGCCSCLRSHPDDEVPAYEEETTEQPEATPAMGESATKAPAPPSGTPGPTDIPAPCASNTDTPVVPPGPIIPGAPVGDAPTSEASSVKERPPYCPNCATNLMYSSGDECPGCGENVYGS
eukprot:CFRG0993T1